MKPSLPADRSLYARASMGTGIGLADRPRTGGERLRYLERMAILDSPPTPFTDAVASTAAAIANTPMAVISLVDERRQWFLGSWGVEATEAPVELSFCAYAILGEAPLLIEDAPHDPRFHDHPAVTGDLHIRFYAGFPLIVGGHALGALCVADDHPRRLSPSQIDSLTTLAARLTAWLHEHARSMGL